MSLARIAKAVTWAVLAFSFFWFAWLAFSNWELLIGQQGQTLMWLFYWATMGGILPFVDNIGYNALVFFVAFLGCFAAINLEYGTHLRRTIILTLETGIVIIFVQAATIVLFDPSEMNLEAIQIFERWGLGWFSNLILLEVAAPLVAIALAYETTRRHSLKGA